MEEEIEFLEEWLSLEKYHFKIITMVTVLADNQKAYRGKLSDLCQYLSIKPVTVNINNIKSALKYLEANGYVNIMVDKDIYTISLSKAAEKNRNIITIKRTWYKLIRDTKSEAAWEQVLKVFLVLMDLSQGKEQKTITYEEIGKMIKCGKSTVDRAIKTICSINFFDFKFQKEVIKTRLENGSYRTLGTIYKQGIYFE
ncbi:MAG: hypothetical protein HDR28_03395 [Lachnospiraceae bacterium]|nr:hypothetical protein [Lachnospiraceae bacterium]